MGAGLIGVLIISHGALGQEFLNVAEHILGPQKSTACIQIEADDNLEQKHQQVLDAVKKLNQDKGVIVLTDMFGGTPSNVAFSLTGESDIEVIAGINLPMLIKILSLREKNALSEVVAESVAAARKYITTASDYLQKAS